MIGFRTGSVSTPAIPGRASSTASAKGANRSVWNKITGTAYATSPSTNAAIGMPR